MPSGSTCYRDCCTLLLTNLDEPYKVSFYQFFFTNSRVLLQDLGGVGYFHSSPFQLYNNGPMARIQPANFVIFNRNRLSDFGAHNQSTSSGIFKAPKTGHYWFHLETHAEKGQASYSLVHGHSDERLTVLNVDCSVKHAHLVTG
jgi:hypothetical protein